MEAVKYLMGAYFHQDWDIDGGLVSDTVSAFLRERRELVMATVDQIGALLEVDLPEGGLDAQLEEWGCQYYAGETDDAYRAWLKDIRDQMRSFLSTSAAS
ncbi:contact-dependent growth inhibition system immunity protein [Nocardioides zhouii]|uniref:CdiI immunity protein domain-containing protein n=1 Tax=Nocardioides zhouii TaxID=1168729 RepID=A0A4Q2T0Q5_9ACTN|nr:contact-dependent growth inhibition system immunity protein [Nocardioides zhouii]RYC10470.1 hypothetical protein EUA94_13170 [Nocardioides zhouii]